MDIPTEIRRLKAIIADKAAIREELLKSGDERSLATAAGLKNEIDGLRAEIADLRTKL